MNTPMITLVWVPIYCLLDSDCRIGARGMIPMDAGTLKDPHNLIPVADNRILYLAYPHLLIWLIDDSIRIFAKAHALTFHNSDMQHSFNFKRRCPSSYSSWHVMPLAVAGTTLHPTHDKRSAVKPSDWICNAACKLSTYHSQELSGELRMMKWFVST